MDFAFAWDWGVVGQAVADLLEVEVAKEGLQDSAKAGLQQAKSLWTKIKWSSAEDAYRKRLLPIVSTTRLLGNPKPVNIDQLYTDLFVYDKLSALRRTATLVNPEKDSYSFEEPSERQMAREVVATGENLYLLGHPGAGKTTFLRYLAILGCKGITEKVPIYVQLRDVARSYDPMSARKESIEQKLRGLIFEYIVNEFEICDFPEPERFVDMLLKKGGAQLLIDGLDEVPSVDGMRGLFIDGLREIARRYPKTQICVTCRIAASEYTFEHFRYAEVAQFTEIQQRRFIEKWYVDDSDRRSRILQAWSHERSRTLRDLGRTPLLLALICLAFDDLNELPERHVDLYREALEALFKRWDNARSIRRDPFYGNLTPHRREQLLQEIAAYFFQKDKIVFSNADAIPVIGGWFAKLPDSTSVEWRSNPADNLLDQIESQHGLIIQRARDAYSFSHLSLQEFLCARSMVEGHPERQLEHIAGQYALELKWREVLIFCAGLLHDGTRLLEILVKSVNKLMNERDELSSFIHVVHGKFLVADWENMNDVNGTEFSREKTPLSIVMGIIERLDQLSWAGVDYSLRRKAVIALSVLSRAEANPEYTYRSLSAEGTSLARYLQGVRLIVDCAAVATCKRRDHVLAGLMTPLRLQ